jgi:hypothetical protein
MKIISAKYGTKDVTEIVQSLSLKNKISFFVSNALFGDPNIGLLKKLVVQIENGEKIEAYENTYLVYPKNTKEKLGIFYTNNNNKLIYNAIDYSLQTIKKASDGIADVVTCVWNKIPNNPFMEIYAQTKTSSHLNQVLQILQTLYLCRDINKKYKYVSFLEHDCLYPEGYFNYNDFESNCICNMNYIGLSNDGWQKRNRDDKPLSQITMKFNYAISHFESILPNALVRNAGIAEPPHEKNNIGAWNCVNPSVHVNHGHHFTSHYTIYSTEKSRLNNYWGTYESYANLFSKNI